MITSFNKEAYYITLIAQETLNLFWATTNGELIMTKAEKFVREVNLYGTPPTQAAAQWGQIHYVAFSDNQDPLIIDLSPYGTYYFKDDSEAHLVEVGGQYYAYLSKSTTFKNTRIPAYMHRRNSKHQKPEASLSESHPPMGISPYTELAKRALHSIRS